MKKAPTPRRKLAVSIVLLLLAAAVAVGGTVAIYTSQVFQRSVVRNRDTEAIRFSSDKLYRVESTQNPEKKYYYCPMTPGQQKMSFTVCNYDQSKNTVVNQQELEYNITFHVANGTDDYEYAIYGPKIDGSKIIKDGDYFETSGSLTGGRGSMVTYSITFAENDYNKVEVTVTVEPKDPTLSKNTKLYATLIPIEYATTQGVSLDWTWNGDDAYNVFVSISGGEDDVVIQWDNEKLDIDPFFLKKMKELEGTTFTQDGTQSTLTIHMNSEDDTAAYQFQFYNHKPRTWTDFPVSIKLKSSNTATDVSEQGVS